MSRALSYLLATKGGMRVSMSWRVTVLCAHVVAIHILLAKLWRVLRIQDGSLQSWISAMLNH